MKQGVIVLLLFGLACIETKTQVQTAPFGGFFLRITNQTFGKCQRITLENIGM